MLLFNPNAVAIDEKFGFSEPKVLNGWEFIRSVVRELHLLLFSTMYIVL